MNTRIGATRTVNCNLAAIDQRQGSRQLALHGAQLILDLPAMKIGTIVLQREFEIPHSSLRT